MCRNTLILNELWINSTTKNSIGNAFCGDFMGKNAEFYVYGINPMLNLMSVEI